MHIDSSRLLTPALCLGLITLALTQEWLIAPHGSGSLALKVLPLVWLLPGLAGSSIRHYKILALLIWLYVLEAATQLYAPRSSQLVFALVQLLLCLIIFASVLRFLRKQV